MKSISDEERMKIAAEATEVSFAPGENIMREGESGDSMYVLTRGEVVITVANAGEVARKQRGDWFGEMALLNDSARTATINAGAEEVQCLKLTRASFDAHMFGEMEDPHAQMELLLAQIPLLNSLPAVKRSQLAEEMTPVTFGEGDSIIIEGDEGDCMYVIDEGTASVRVKAVGEVAVLGEREYFGEQALLNHAPRTATIIATSEVVRCYKLSRAQFNDLVMEMMAPIKQTEILLKQVPLLSNLDPGKLSRLAQATRTRKYAKGEDVMEEGAIGNTMYIVQSGEAIVSVEGVGEVARK
eukprot:SAG11_NODE_7401_length_1149_cov_1.282857_2_plen_297_part_01